MSEVKEDLEQMLQTARGYHQAGRLAEAETLYRRILQLNPQQAEAWQLLGALASQVGQSELALELIGKAVAIAPNFPAAWSNLCKILRDLGRPEEAIAAARQAIAVDPNFAEGYSKLGAALRDKGMLEEAVAAFRQALVLRPHFAEACNNLGGVLGELGLFDESLAVLRQAVALSPDMPTAHSNLAYNMHYHPSLGPEEIAEEHRRWNRQHAAPLKKFMEPHGNSRDPERRLRVGYVSPDFREHAVAPMVLPLVANHDRRGYEIFCYSDVTHPDGMTERFRRAADQWRNTACWSDAQMAAEIRKDQIDILVDLAGHTNGNRLLVFARKPAPVQVARQGYPDTTGLETMDYRITDGHADPPGLSDRWHSEKLVRLAPTNWIYQPPEEAVKTAVAPLAEGPIVFGCFNNFSKVTEPMLRVWARILALVPGSKLLLKSKHLAIGSVQDRVRGILAQEGIVAERVEMSGWRSMIREHLALYNRVAVGLDPYPYHGTTTTCEALWMGVPVVTLAGRTHVSRVGVSLLSNVGLSELVAPSAEEYVRLAVELATDRARLARMRASLRQRMEQSPLLDWSGFARNMEAAYRQMWRTWCAGEGR